MCGICCIITDISCNSQDSERYDVQILEKLLSPFVARRGPDVQGQREISTCLTSNSSLPGRKITFVGSVLHLRGKETLQPLEDKDGNVLLWNGEIFGGNIKVLEEENDGEILFKSLCALDINENYAHCFVDTFQNINGPWSFIFWQAKRKYLWFGRDFFGRRSLLWQWPVTHEHLFALSSVTCKDSGVWEEVPAQKLYCIDLAKDECTTRNCVMSYNLLPPWEVNTVSLFHSEANLKVHDQRTVPCCQSDNTCVVPGVDNLQSADDFYHDSHLSALVDGKLGNRSTQTSKDNDICNCQIMLSTVKCVFQDCVERFLNVMECSVRRRVTTVPTRYKFPNYWKFKKDDESLVFEKSRIEKEMVNSSTNSDKFRCVPRIGILFSGGIDSMFIAALVDRLVPENEPIDLINVAFEKRERQNQSKHRRRQGKEVMVTPRYDVPDRLTGQTGLSELNPRRQWNFIEVDVTLDELQHWRQRRIKDVVYPSATVLDDSIGCANWFAARGHGRLLQMITTKELALVDDNYTSPVKVLLTGMGADEQLGGYARHRTKFEQFGWQGLDEEMKMELNRISSRNLGRDDRCISDHGREARFPFLDEDVVSFLNSVPVWIKCDPRLARGYGEKVLLREAAKRLGLSLSTQLPKRAIQFGSRIAKLESTSERGNDTCERLT